MTMYNFTFCSHNTGHVTIIMIMVLENIMETVQHARDSTYLFLYCFSFGRTTFLAERFFF